MAKTKVPGGYIDDGSITSSHLHSSHGITTNDIGEHTNNKYYTDARVDARLAASKSTNIITTGDIQITSDSGKAKFGTSNDFAIYHTGYDTYLDNATGHLVLRNQANDKDIVLQTDDGSGGTADYLRLIGGHERILASQHFRIADTKQIQLGDDSDFSANFNGNHTFITNNTGILYLTQAVDDGVVHFRNDNGSGGVTQYITLHGQTGEVRLTHYGNVKLKTQPDGIDVTGHIDATTLTTTGNVAVGGNLTVTGTTTTVNTVTMNAQNAVVFEGATADAHETTLTIIDPTADRTINLPNQSGTIPVLAAASNTAITATPAELNYVDGVTSNIQTQLNAKQATISSSTDLTLSSIVATSSNESRFNALSIGGDSDVYLYESATNAFTIRTGASGAYKYFTFLADGKLNLANDGLQIGGTEVISGGRNISNVGTISASGNITTSGAVITGDDIVLPNDKDVIFKNASGSDDGTKITRAGGNALRFKYTGNVAVFDALADNGFQIRNSNDTVVFQVVPNSTLSSSYTDVIGGLRLGGTVVINSSRNLVNIGTISSGAITSTGNSTFSGVIGVGGTSTNSNYGVWLQNNKWYATQYSSSHDVVRMNANTAGQLDIYNQTDSAFAVIRTGGINIGSTQVIDDSRNLTNIGNITTSGNIILSSGNKVIFGGDDTYNAHLQYTDNGSGDHFLSIKTEHNDTITERIKVHAQTGVVTFNGAYTFPTSDGSANQVLQTDGSGALSFATVSSGGSGFSTITEPAAGQLKIGAQAGANEGGEILLEKASANGGGSYTTDIFLDNYQNQFRIHSGGSVDLTVDTSGNMTVPGDISLPYGSINDSGTDLVIHGTNAVVLKTDGGTGLTFPNNSVHATFGGNITFAEYLYHSGDTDTNLRFQTDRATLTSGGGAIVDAHSNGNLYLTGSTVQVYGNIAFNGSITGNGSALTTLNASNLSSGTVAEARLPSTARRDETGSTANYGPWYSTATFIYDATNGTRYYWLLIGTIAASSSRGMIEYEVKDDENYPMGLRGTLFFSGFNSGTSFSVQHDVTTAYASSHEPQVRLDTSRRIWMRFPSNDWASYMRFRVHKQGAFTTNTSWSTGTTRYDTAGSPSAPANASSDILPGQNLRATSSSVTGTVPTYNHALTSHKVKARKGFFGERIAVGASQTDVHGTYHLYNNSLTYLNGATIIDDNLTITNGTITSGQINATTSADATPAIIATNSGGLSSVIQRWVGDSDSMELQNLNSAGDYALYNTQQNNGIDFYDGTGGIAFRYNNAIVAMINSTGGFRLESGSYKIGNTSVINSSRVLENVTANASIITAGRIGDARMSTEYSETRIGATEHSLVNFTSQSDYDKRAGYSTMMKGTTQNSNVVNTPEAQNYWFYNVHAKRDTGGGTAATLIGFDSPNNFYSGMTTTSSGAITWAKHWTDRNDGTGSGLDADTVDGVEASSFLRSDAADTATGNITLGASTKLIFGNNTAYGIGAGGHNYRSGYFDTLESGGASDPLELVYYQGNKVNIGGSGGNKPLSAGSFEITGTSVINSSRQLQNIASLDSTTTTTIQNAVEGTGLNADTLDGINSASFARVDAGNDYTNYANNNHFYSNTNMATASGNQASLECFSNGSGNDAFMTFHVGGDFACYFGLDGGTNKLSVGGWSMGANSYEIYHSGNKPSLSTLGFTGASNANYITNNNQLTNGAGYITSSGTAANATQAGGLSVHSGRNNEANKIVRTDANGYIQAGWINTTSGSTTSVIDRIYSSYDGYIRYYTPANYFNAGGMGEKQFNNQGRNHSTYTNFNTNMPAGVHYLQQGNNGPTGTASHQFYGMKFGLGNEYGSTSGSGQYFAQMYFPRAAQGGGNGLYFRDMEDGTIGSWRQVDAGTLQTYSSAENGASTIHRLASNGYSQIQNWQNVGGTGLYSTTANSGHFLINQNTSYGTWRSTGSRGGYDGLVLDGGGGVAFMTDSGGNGGIYRQASSRWYMYHHVGNNCTGFSNSTTSSSYSVYVSGALYATGDIVGSSDERLKTEIKTIPNALDKVLKLRGVTYKWKDTTEGGTCVNNITETRMGVIAQEVEPILPEVVTHDKENDRYGVSYGHLTGVLIEAVKELKQEVNELKKELEEVKNG